MSKKKSLGHNPLAYSMLGHASFDFISPTEKEEVDKKKKSFNGSKKGKVNKVTVSYYLEEPIVEHIKHLAEENDTTYSSVISQLLKDSFKNLPEE
ncbi:MAG: hypothetical protein WD016_05880 [Balneolaceae bacterium]